MIRIFAATLGAVLMLTLPTVSAAQAPANASSLDPKGHCAALTGDYGDIQDAPSQVMSSAPVAATDNLPNFCQVVGYISPNIGFELRLPAKWNGKFFQAGCGGFCGAPMTGNCDDALRRGYACMAFDMGHKSTATDAKWALNNLQAEVDWGFRSTHVAAVAGKALTQKYYGKAPSRAYFVGGSTGGRQALIEAQNFPWDFDGIIGGAPPIEQIGDGFTLAWNALAIMGPDGFPIVTSEDFVTLHKAVLAMCDMDDGVKDAIVSDPLACRFDPASLLCKGDKTAACLTAPQVEAVRKIYQGPVNSKGEKLYTSGSLKGSELAWLEAYGRTPTHDHYYGMSQQGLRYMAFTPDAGADFKLTSFDWDKDYKRLGVAERLFSSDNPDLRKFKAAGGKFIFWQGFADQAVMPEKSIDYYQMVERAMGGRDQTQDFFRLFMLPGVHHGIIDTGANVIDYIAAIEDWVENGKAPDKLVGAHVKTGPSYGLKYPLDPTNVGFTRAFYPYPMMAKYKGSGDTNDAANFVPVPLKGAYDSKTRLSVARK